MAKSTDDLIMKGEKLREMIYEGSDGMYDEMTQYLPEREYAEWKAECITYLEVKYPKYKFTEKFLSEFNKAHAGDVDAYERLLGYLTGIKNNEKEDKVVWTDYVFHN